MGKVMALVWAMVTATVVAMALALVLVVVMEVAVVVFAAGKVMEEVMSKRKPLKNLAYRFGYDSNRKEFFKFASEHCSKLCNALGSGCVHGFGDGYEIC